MKCIWNKRFTMRFQASFKGHMQVNCMGKPFLTEVPQKTHSSTSGGGGRMWLWLGVHLRTDNTMGSETEGEMSQILFWVSVTETLNCSQIWKEPDNITYITKKKRWGGKTLVWGIISRNPLGHKNVLQNFGCWRFSRHWHHWPNSCRSVPGPCWV